MIKCPLCQKAYKEMEDVYLHVDKEHGDLIPEGWTASRYLYFVKTKKEHGKCVVCKQPTGWNNQTNKYHRFCTNPKCKEEYRKIFEERMIGKHGKISLLDDPEHQKKMLSNRSISGTYKWSDGGETTYTGSYELDFLRMLDNLLDFEAGDVMAPSPHTYWYEHEGVRRFYIPDFYIPSLNLEIEIKDGGNNPNKHHKIQAVDKVKEKLKDDVMTSQSKVSYIKVVNKEYGTFFTFLNRAKQNYINGFKEKPIFLLENVANMAPIVSSKTNKVEYVDEVNENEEDTVTESKTKFNSEDLQDHHGIAAVIIDNRGRILMQDHVKYNFWTIPVGKVKHDETVEEGLTVELKEELDIVPTKYYELFTTKRSYEREGKMVTVTQHVFFISEYKGTVKNNEPEKHRSIKWMYPDEIMHKPALSDATKDYLEYVKVNGNPSAQKEELIPVYVLLTYTNSLMAKAIKFVTHQPYSHAGISLDSSLTNIFTYGRKEVKDKCKFTVESIFDGALGAVKDSTPYSLYVSFFKKYQFETLKERIENIKEDINKHGYSYIGLINFALGKETYNDYRMFCSQFVADVIKAGDPNRVKKHASRYSPSDLSKVKGMHFVTKGILGKYNQNKVEERVAQIKRSVAIKSGPNPLIESALECDEVIGTETEFGTLYKSHDDSLIQLYENGSMLDFVNEINNTDDIDRLEHCMESVDKPEYLNKIRARINALENSQHCETDKHLYIIIESTGTRLVNNRLNIFNANDNDTTIYTVEECREGTNVTFNVDKYRRKGLSLVQEKCENELPALESGKIQVSYKISSDEPKVIESICENFINVKAWKPMAPLTTLNLNDLVAMESYAEDMLNSINIDIDAVEIKRFK